MNRRSFFAATTAVIGISLFGGWPRVFAASPTRAKPVPRLLPLSSSISHDTLKAYVGQGFKVYGGPGARYVLNLVLISIEDRYLGSETDEFSAHFRGPVSNPLDTGVYFFEHPSSGKFQLMLEPIGTSASGLDYRAIFNLLLD